MAATTPSPAWLTLASLLLVGQHLARATSAASCAQEEELLPPLCHLTTASDPSTSLMVANCTAISAGRPLAAEDSLERRATVLQSDWRSLHAGWSKHVDACATPAGCREQTQWVAVEVGVPGHAYEDVVRSAPYARASFLGRCPLSIKVVARTHHRQKVTAAWPTWHHRNAFAGVPPNGVISMPVSVKNMQKVGHPSPRRRFQRSSLARHPVIPPSPHHPSPPLTTLLATPRHPSQPLTAPHQPPLTNLPHQPPSPRRTQMHLQGGRSWRPLRTRHATSCQCTASGATQRSRGTTSPRVATCAPTTNPS